MYIVRSTTGVSAIAIGLASYHILVFTLWFGGSSLMSPHNVYCKNEGVSFSTIGLQHIKSKHPCEQFDVSLCKHLFMGFNPFEGVWFHVDDIDKEKTPDWIVDNCLDIAKVEGTRGWIIRFFHRFLSAFQAWMSFLTAVFVLLLVKIN